MTSPTQSPENRLTSEKYAEFFEAVDILYIKDNISGRNLFTAAWPDAASHILGEELQRYDREGTQDRERRAVLENEAEDRRLALLEIVETLEAKSVKEGALQLEYVQSLVNQLGRKLSLCIYSRWLVDRFIPPSPDEMAAAPPPPPEVVTPKEVTPIATPAPPPAAAAPVAPIQPRRMESMDHIRPISVEQDMSPPPQPDPEPEPPPHAAPPAPQQPPPQQQPSFAAPSAFQTVEEEPEGPPLFVAGQVPATPIKTIAETAETEELIVETQGQSETHLAAPEQESMAPVVGGPKKPSGLKILSIADSDEPPKTGENNQ